ncbi:MAG: hypothetical protein EBX20_11610, partial [Rhodobacterales bacterium]|nr:hypothetical protein [Rhodobacterales bacterium]
YYQVEGCAYFGFTSAWAFSQIYKNGSGYTFSVVNFHSGDTTDGEAASPNVSAVIDMNGSSDYLEIYVYQSTTGTPQIEASSASHFGAYKLIGV